MLQWPDETLQRGSIWARPHCLDRTLTVRTTGKTPGSGHTQDFGGTQSISQRSELESNEKTC